MKTGHLFASTLLLLAVAIAPPAHAGLQFAHTTVDAFSWASDGQAFGLHSQTGGGIVVTRAEPSPFHGLQRGDVILAVDGSPVRQVEQFTRALLGRTSPVRLRVRRGHAETTLVWSHADYRLFAPPEPPAPPQPPAPPPPPAPPAPPAHI
jgi:hypothetical protein